MSYADTYVYIKNLFKNKHGRVLLGSFAGYFVGITAICVAAASTGEGRKINLNENLEDLLLYGGIVVSEASSIFGVIYTCLREKKLLDIFKNPNPVITK